MAAFQSMKSFLGVFYENFTVDHSSWSSLFSKYFLFSILPEAPKMQDRNMTCWWNMTLFNLIISSSEKSCLASKSINQLSLYLGKEIPMPLKRTLIVNLLHFSHTKASQHHVTLFPYLAKICCNGCDDRPSSTARARASTETLSFSPRIDLKLKPKGVWNFTSWCIK